MPTTTDRPPKGGRLRAATAHKVVRDTGWTMLTELAGMAGQLGTLVLIGRAFSKEAYGLFAGTVAFMSVLSPFTTIGMGYVLVHAVAGRGADPDVETGRAFTMVALGGLLGTAAVLAVGHLVVPGVPPAVLVALGLGELVFSQITYTGRFCAQALDRPADGARVVATVWLLRLLVAVVYLVAAPRPTLTGWATCHALASLLGTVLTVLACRHLLSVQTRVALADRATVREGLGYSLSIGAIYLKNDADKTMLLSFHQTEAAGLYGLASRVTTPLFAPVRALADSTFSRFFRDGARSADAAYRLATRTTIAGVLLTGAGGLVIAAAAPALPLLLGEKWSSAVPVTQLLAFVPMLSAMQMYAFNALMGLGRRQACVSVTVLASMLNIGLNVALIPRYHWRGATVATAAAEVFSVITLWVLLRRGVHGSPRTATVQPARAMQAT